MAASLGAGETPLPSTAIPNVAEPALPPSSSAPVEMSNLPPSRPEMPETSQPDTEAGAQRPNPDTNQATASSQPSTTQETRTTTPPPINDPLRTQSEALGPATDLPMAALTPSTTTGTVLSITLMLTTGARHPYKIDERYLRNRKVEAVSQDGGFDPREISGYKLKELIWTDWRAEWEPRPASPSSIRLIILGRLLEDKSPLRDFPFKLEDTNVVHMTVKPADFLDDDDTGGKTGKGHALRGRDGEERGAGCRCVIL